jgi:hypothetical protein
VKPQVLHFSGHGSRAELAFENAAGRTVSLDNNQLEKLLRVGAGRIRLVVFNSCDSAAQAELACNHVDVAIGWSRVSAMKLPRPSRLSSTTP